MNNPFALADRPYWKGCDRNEDESLAEELFFGRARRGKKGRIEKEYLVQDSPHERLAEEALVRLLTYYTANQVDAPHEIIVALCSALKANGASERRLVFKFRKKGKRSDLSTDYAIALLVASKVSKEGWKTEAAVHEARKAFGLSRKAIFAAMRRIRRQIATLKESK